MLISWIVDLCLTTNLTMQWQQPRCGFTFTTDNNCPAYDEQSMPAVRKRGTTSYNAYAGALATGAVLAGFEV